MYEEYRRLEDCELKENSVEGKLDGIATLGDALLDTVVVDHLFKKLNPCTKVSITHQKSMIVLNTR